MRVVPALLMSSASEAWVLSRSRRVGKSEPDPAVLEDGGEWEAEQLQHACR